MFKIEKELRIKYKQKWKQKKEELQNRNKRQTCFCVLQKQWFKFSREVEREKMLEKTFECSLVLPYKKPRLGFGDDGRNDQR